MRGLAAEEDCKWQVSMGAAPMDTPHFNSRPSCDGRLVRAPQRAGLQCFNSRPSCDGRPALPVPLSMSMRFQFTPVV